MSNIIQKQINESKFSAIQATLFKNTQENQMMKITHEDLDMLRKYEKLLYQQNRKILKQLSQRGQQAIKFADKKELRHMLEIKQKKKYLIERLKAQEQEGKFRNLQEKIENEVNAGVRRAKIMPTML